MPGGAVGVMKTAVGRRGGSGEGVMVGEGVIVGNLKPKPDFEFTADLVSLRTKVTKGNDN